MLTPWSRSARRHEGRKFLPLQLTLLSMLLLTACGGNHDYTGGPSSSSSSSTSASVSISPPQSVSVSISPPQAGLTVSQQISLSATTNDMEGVIWTIKPSGGSFSAISSLSGASVTFTAPATAGVYTVTATSVSDATVSASASIGVTDLAGVYSYHNDLARDGANNQEYVLTPANVNSASFGKIFSCTVDGAIYAQPLWVANLTIAGKQHNVVFVATEHDSLFAFDADQNPCEQLWSASLIDAAHGATPGETTVISGGPGAVVGHGAGTITPETGVTGTPVIDPATDTLYVVSTSMVGTSFYQRLHAIDLTTGDEESGSPVTIAATYPGSGDGGATVTFNAQTQLQRAGLAFVNGTVYIAWASHEDTPPYYGWIIGYTYDGSSFTQTSVLNVTPNVGYGGIWMSGSAPAADSDGNLYLLTGNGTFDATQTAPLPSNDYGDSLLQLSSTLLVSQYFTPSDEDLGVPDDLDFGSGGAAVLVNLPEGSSVTHLIVGGGKDGNLYVLNRDDLGGYSDQGVWQEIPIGGSIYSTPAFWNNYLYLGGANTALLAYQLDQSAQFSLVSSSIPTFAYVGTSPSVSASQGSNGIVWTLDDAEACYIKTNVTPPVTNGCAPAILQAFDATNVQNELWSSSTSTADTAGFAVRNAVPTIANGKVYIGTRGNNTGGPYGSTSISGELDVYGLK